MLARAGVSPEGPGEEGSTSKPTWSLAGFSSTWATGLRAPFLTSCQPKPALSSVPCSPPHRAVHSMAARFRARRREPASKNITVLWNVIVERTSIAFAMVCRLEERHRSCLYSRGGDYPDGVNTGAGYWEPVCRRSYQSR